MQQTEPFWSVNLGNIATAIIMLISFWLAHVSNAKRISRDAEEWQEVKTKVNLIYDWFKKYVVGLNGGKGMNIFKEVGDYY